VFSWSRGSNVLTLFFMAPPAHLCDQNETRYLMHPIDSFQIQFNPQQLSVLNIAMAFLMFSVAIDVRISDFGRVAQFPRSVLMGLLAQYLIFPFATLVVIWTFAPPASVAMGMILVSVCPSGNITNFLVHYARSNVALSVTLNAIIVLGAALVTPFGFLFWTSFVPATAALRHEFTMSWVEMLQIVFQLIVLPLLIGILLNQKYPNVTNRIRPWAQRLSLLIFIGILVMAVWSNRVAIATYIPSIFWIVAIHNVLGLGTGYWLARLNRLPELDARTLAFETGVHNTALGLLLIFRFFDGLGGMALIAAWWGIWDLISGLALAQWWRRQPAHQPSALA
jgi:bile acid:Na+ symporter, BASS family